MRSMKAYARETMGRDPVWRLLRRFSGPAILSMAAAASYTIADAIFIGRLGPTALAAMGVAYPLALSFVAIASGTAIGTTSLISRSLGAGDSAMADKAAGAAITLCFFLSALIAAICLPLLDSILGALGAEAAVLAMARDYSSILIRFLLFGFLGVSLASMIRADGHPFFASAVAICASLCNIVLDPILIFGIGPVPAMGISGAAAATALSQGAGVCLFVIYILAGKTAYRFQPSCFRPDPRIIVGIYRIGFASILRSGAQFLVMGIVNRSASAFGVIPLAIVGVLVRIGRFVQMPTLGLGQGMLPLVGFNFAAGNLERVGELVWKAGLAGTVWASLCWAIIMLFPSSVLAAFNADPDFLAQGTSALRWYTLILFAISVQSVPSFFFQAIGRPLPSAILAIARPVIFLLPALLILPRHMGLTGLWICFPAADILALILGLSWLILAWRSQGITAR